MSKLELANVWFKYPGTKHYVLKNVNLVANEGEVSIILGGNGAGKTTLLMIASGLLMPSQGKVLINGSNLTNLLPGIRKAIGIMFQNPDDQLFNPTVYEEIAFVLKQINRNEEDKILDIIKKLKLPKEILSKPPYLLSFGIKKMVALASILVYEPSIILLDEPFSNLSPNYIKVIMEIIRELRSEDKTVIIASSNTESVSKIGDNYYILSKGRIIGKGGKEILLKRDLLHIAELSPPTLINLMLDSKCIERLANLDLQYNDIVNLLKMCCEKLKESREEAV